MHTSDFDYYLEYKSWKQYFAILTAGVNLGILLSAFFFCCFLLMFFYTSDPSLSLPFLCSQIFAMDDLKPLEPVVTPSAYTPKVKI